MITVAQIRAARGLLDMTQQDLAKHANVSLRTMRRIEAGFGTYDRTLEAIRAALEKRGV